MSIQLADAGGRVAAGGAGALLEVEAPAAAPDADRVRLVPALAEAASTLLPCKITGYRDMKQHVSHQGELTVAGAGHRGEPPRDA